MEETGPLASGFQGRTLVVSALSLPVSRAARKLRDGRSACPPSDAKVPPTYRMRSEIAMASMRTNAASPLASLGFQPVTRPVAASTDARFAFVAPLIDEKKPPIKSSPSDSTRDVTRGEKKS